MTHPDDLFEPADPLDDDTAAWLDRHFGLPTPGDVHPTAGEREAIRIRVLGAPASSPSPSPRAAGIVAGPPTAFPSAIGTSIRRVPGLAAAAVLVLILAATLAAYLRSDDGERLPGAAATASVLPFAPGSALASPVAATCATDATLLMIPGLGAEPADFADLPFPVAWDRTGTLVVQDGDAVLREIPLPERALLLPTAQPNVILAAPIAPGHQHEPAVLIDIASGATAMVGPFDSLSFTGGPYLFWASDASYTRWSVTDLRDFETVDITERFRPATVMPWRPYVDAFSTSADGTVLLASTASYNPVNETLPAATPFAADLPPFEISHDAIVIDGSLDDIRLVGPRATTSGAMALSPDGEMLAFLAADEAGQRRLVIEDATTGETIRESIVEATYSNSLLFSADGTTLYATHGTTLEAIPVHPDAATPAATARIELPDSAYRIAGASPDRTKLLLARTTSASGEVSLWVDLATGEIRELPGQPGWKYLVGVTGSVDRVRRYLPLAEIGSKPGDSELRIVDMATGEVIFTADGDDATLVAISDDGSTLLISSEHAVDILRPASGRTVTFPAPDGVEGISWTFALSPNGACAAGNWDLEGDAIETVLLPSAGGEPVALPPSGVGGWVAAGDE